MNDTTIHKLKRQIDQLTAENKALQQQLKTLPHETEKTLEKWLVACDNANNIEQLDLLLGDIVSHLNVDGATLTFYNSDSQLLHLISAYPIVNSIEKSRSYYQVNNFPWTWQQLSKGETITLNSLDELPKKGETDLNSYNLLDQPSSLQVPIIFEGRIQSLLEFHTQGRIHHWSDSDEPLIKKIAPAFFSATNRIYKSIIDDEGLTLLHFVLQATGTGYAVFNHDRSSSQFGPTMPEMLGITPGSQLNTAIFDNCFSQPQINHFKNWWNKIFTQQDLSPLIIEQDQHQTKKYFKCSPTIITKHDNGTPEKVLAGFSDVSQLQAKSNSLTWLSNALKKLHTVPSEENLYQVFKDLLRHLNASGAMISINNNIILSESSDNALVTEALLSNHASDIELLNQAVCDIVTQQGKLFFQNLDEAPETITNNARIISAINYCQLKGIYAISINHNQQTPAYIVIDWDHAHKIPIDENIDLVLSTIGDAFTRKRYKIKLSPSNGPHHK